MGENPKWKSTMYFIVIREKISGFFDWNNQNPFIILISLKSLDCKALIQKKPCDSHSW